MSREKERTRKRERYDCSRDANSKSGSKCGGCFKKECFRSATGIILSVGRTFLQKVLEKDVREGFIYFFDASTPKETVSLLENLVENHSTIEYCFTEPMCMRAMGREHSIFMKLDSESELSAEKWILIPPLFSEEVEGFWNSLKVQKRCYFRININGTFTKPTKHNEMKKRNLL